MRKFKIISMVTIFVVTILFIQQAFAEELINLSVREADIKSVLVMLADQSELNMVPDNTVTGNVTVNLKNVSLEEAIETLKVAYNYKFKKINEQTYIVSMKRMETPLFLEIEDNMMTIDVDQGDIREVLNQIAVLAEVNILMDNNVRGPVSVKMKDVPLNTGLNSLLELHGFSLSKDRNVYKVFRIDGNNHQMNNLAISVIDDKVSIDVEQADIGGVLRTIAKLSNRDMILYGGVRGTLDLKLDEVDIDDAIAKILAGTRFACQKEDGVYLIGDKNIHSPTGILFTKTEVISLQYLEAEKLPSLLPGNFPLANIKVLKEHNAISVTGTQGDIRSLKHYISQIDKKIPQIIVDALIIDVTHNKGMSVTTKLQNTYDDGKTNFFDSSVAAFKYISV